MRNEKIDYKKLILDPANAIKGENYYGGTGLITIKKSLNHGNSLELFSINVKKDYPFRMSNGRDYSVLYEAERTDEVSSEKEKEETIVKIREDEKPYKEIIETLKETLERTEISLREEVTLDLNKDLIRGLLDEDYNSVIQLEVIRDYQHQDYDFFIERLLKDFISLEGNNNFLNINLNQNSASQNSNFELNLPLRSVKIKISREEESKNTILEIKSDTEFLRVRLTLATEKSKCFSPVLKEKVDLSADELFPYIA